MHVNSVANNIKPSIHKLLKCPIKMFLNIFMHLIKECAMKFIKYENMDKCMLMSVLVVLLYTFDPFFFFLVLH